MGDPADGDVLEGGGPPRLGPGLNLRLRPPRLGSRGRWTAAIGGALAAVVVVFGGLLFPGPTGVYVPGPEGLRRISPGALLAVGPRGWIVAECNDAHRCRSELIDRATGARRDVGPPLTVGPLPGLISPDGRTVALYRIEDTGHIELDILDIAGGEVRAADVEVEQDLTVGMIAWSPDGRLFAVAEGGAIRVVDRDSGRAGPIGPPLPPVRQLAIRTLP